MNLTTECATCTVESDSIIMANEHGEPDFELTMSIAATTLNGINLPGVTEPDRLRATLLGNLHRFHAYFLEHQNEFDGSLGWRNVSYSYNLAFHGAEDGRPLCIRVKMVV